MSTRARTPPGGGALAAYVLHQYDWSETSLIVELFVRPLGRIVVAAKGAKRPTSNFRAVLIPFAPIHVLLGKAPADPQAEVLNLRSAEWAMLVAVPFLFALLAMAAARTSVLRTLGQTL